ncbi:VOC family protein [Paenibacillus sp. MMO-58]|uniref:VOC family protein n=1 Tax=Paenibacillus sp. MMO-58 TaxID=3081290 RepID=UPI0030181CA8
MNPISNKINGIFIPVSNVQNARDWYCDILGLPADGEIYFGHIYVLPLEGPSIVLDSKIYSTENLYTAPAFQFHTADIEQAYAFMQEKKVELIMEIQNGHWFNSNTKKGGIR